MLRSELSKTDDSAFPYVDQFGDVSRLEVVKHGRLVEVREVGHVLAPLKLGWVDLLHLILLQYLALVLADLDRNLSKNERNWFTNARDSKHNILKAHLVALRFFDGALGEASVLHWNPA